MIDDLRPCSAHKTAINQCELCWPHFLRHLGVLCIPKDVRMRDWWIPRTSLFKPTRKEQHALATQIGLA